MPARRILSQLGEGYETGQFGSDALLIWWESPVDCSLIHLHIVEKVEFPL